MRKLERELEKIESNKPSIVKSSLDLKEANSEILKKNVTFFKLRWKVLIDNLIKKRS
jgi:hypothetical protein